jgi:hypothetical protein
MGLGLLGEMQLPLYLRGDEEFFLWQQKKRAIGEMIKKKKNDLSLLI